MKIKEHEESFNEHKETIFRWALEVKGIENSQRIIGLHTSRAIIDLLSIHLLKKEKISPGKQINHRWFKSLRASGKIPNFPNKKQIVEKIVELELLCEKLTYGSKRPETEAKKALDLFHELESKIRGLENEKE
ncbi:hypothetical protein HYY71_01255 [Candidatus Woesearchaeota archaeon]|nr:hypothetical protein [Candidatus Woesearchaeota archaeon]